MLACLLALAWTALAAGDEPAPGDGAKRHIILKSGIDMAYREAGSASDPPLILLHGLGDSSRSWALLVPELSKRHHLYMLDQRGHGETATPACCYALPDLAYDVIAFMDARKIERAVVAGHSLGSFVAQQLAAAYPSRVSRLLLLASADTTVGVEFIDWLWSQTSNFGARVSPAFVDEWQSNPTPVDPAFLTKVKRETEAVPVHVWRGVARSLLTEDHRRFLPDITLPTLILWGEKDSAFPPATQERLRKALPHARFKAYPEVGHNLHWEIPKPVAADIEAFLGTGS